MKRKDFLAEIIEMSDADLKKKADDMRDNLMRNRFRKATGQGAVSTSTSSIRRSIARIETVRKQRGK